MKWNPCGVGMIVKRTVSVPVTMPVGPAWQTKSASTPLIGLLIGMASSSHESVALTDYERWSLTCSESGAQTCVGGCALVQVIRFTSCTVWGAVSGAGAQPYLGARTRIVRRQDDRWGVIPARCCLRPLGL
jgi:hypothetical protein